MVRTAILVVALVLILVTTRTVLAQDACNQPAAQPVTYTDLPGNPFAALPSSDGCSIFVSLIAADKGAKGGVAVLRRRDGIVSLANLAPIPGAPTTMVFSPDNRVLIVANGSGVVFLDVMRLVSGQSDPVINSIDDAQGIPPDTAHYMGSERTSLTHEAGSSYVNITEDSRFLFVSDEWTQAITVIDLRRGISRASVVGRIPVGVLPVALTFSSDQKLLFSTSEIGLESYGWPIECKDEMTPGQSAPIHRQGAVLVIDVARAETDPPHAVISKAQAGCAPVRLVISPDGRRAYVTARNSDALLAFDSAKLVNDPMRALIGRVPVGRAPVGINMIDQGRKIVVTNSNRFAGDAGDRQSLTVIDAANIASGAPAILGTIPAGAFPREIRVTADQRTMLVTNFASKTLELIDIPRLPN